jgi:DNA polymerase III subunit epsilon
MYIGFDFETQGFDAKTNAPTEFGMVAFDETGKELNSVNFIIKSPLTKPQTKEIVELTGITDEMIENEGVSEKSVVELIVPVLKEAKALFAYNAQFDTQFLKEMLARNGVDTLGIPVICAMRQVDYPKRYSCKKLSHLAFDHKIYPEEGEDAHRAIADVRLMIKLLARYGIEKIIADSKVPKVKLRIFTEKPWEDGSKSNDYAKEQGFKFDPATKFWCKEVRETEVEQIITGSLYPVERV